MASYTPNYNLKKPADADTYDIADANGNMDLIDTALHSQNQAIANKTTNVEIGGTYNTLEAACQAFLDEMGSNKYAVGNLPFNSFRYLVECYKNSNSWASMSIFGYDGLSYHCWKENGTWKTYEISKIVKATKRKVYYNTSTQNASIKGIKIDIPNGTYYWLNMIITTRYGIHTVLVQTGSSSEITVRIHVLDAFNSEVLSQSISGRTLTITSNVAWNQFCVEGSTNIVDASSLNFGEVFGS